MSKGLTKHAAFPVISGIEAARCKATTHDFPHLLVVGIEKPQWDNSEEACRANELGLSGHIHVTGVIDKDLVWALIKKALALCYPSLYEGFGLVVIEAMDLGTPVITANVSARPEIAGEAAILVDPADTNAIAAAMRRLITDRDLYEDLVRRGLERASEFSWDRATAETLAVLLDAALTTRA